MNLSKKFLVAAILAGSVCTASANEVLVTAQPAKGATLLSFDVAPTGEVAGFQFTIKDPRISEKSVDTSACVADLPKGVTGICKAADGELGVIVFSPAVQALAKDSVLAVGSIRIKGAAEGDPQVANVVFSDRAGKPLPGTGKIEGNSGRQNRGRGNDATK